MKTRAQSQVNQAAQQAKQQGRRLIDEQKHNAVGHLDKIAKALHDTAKRMRDQNEQTAGNMVDQAARGLEQLSSRLRDQDPEVMFRQVRDMARRQPALFIGGTVIAGFMLARFLKSSSDEQHSMGMQRSSRHHGDSSDSYVTSAHANPDEVVAGRAGMPPEMPTGRRNY